MDIQKPEMEDSPKIYVYKMTDDNGGAPCAKGGLLTLGICKPIIRRKADKGDWIIGLGGKRLGEGIIYIAKVSKAVGVEYYQNHKYAERLDCIYHFRNGKLVRKKSASLHENPENKTKDIGKGPKYPNARVLLSTHFRYFGRNKAEIPKYLLNLARGIGRNHRVNYEQDKYDDLKKFVDALTAYYPGKKIQGEPRDAVDPKACHSRDEGSQEHHRPAH